jgi:hypothetical protein
LAKDISGGRRDYATSVANEEDDHAPGSQHEDAVLPVTVGTVLWAVALAALLPFRSRLQASGSDWWIWVCATGLALGVLGSWWVRRRRNAFRRGAR